MPEIVTCDACHRAAPDKETVLAGCGAHMTCPRSVRPVDPAHDAVIACKCGATTVVATAAMIASGKPLNIGNLCQRSFENCKAEVINGGVSFVKVKKAPKAS